MTTRTGYAVQYQAKNGSGREDLFMGPTTSQVVSIDGEIMLWNRHETASEWGWISVPTPQHSPARVVKVRETITREVIE